MATKAKDSIVVVLEGGLVSNVIIVDDNEPDGYREPTDYEVLDYDVFDSGDVTEHWNALSNDLKAYLKKHLPEEYEKFQEAMEYEASDN